MQKQQRIFLLGIFFFYFFCLQLYSQAPDTSWTRNFHRGIWEVVFSIQQTSDDGFIMVGESHLLNDYHNEIFLLKTDQNGDSLWAKVIGNNEDFYPYSVKEDPYGGYVIAGKKEYGSSPRNAFLLKTNENGDSLWTYFYGDNRNTLANDVTCTFDSGYVMTGYRNMSGSGENIVIIKVDANGNGVWLKIYNRGGDETGNCINQTSDGGFIIGGETDYHTTGRTDFYLIKTDSLGDTLWTQTYGRSDDDRCYSVQQTSDGGYILFGTSDSASYATRSLAIKIDSLGNVLWQRIFDRQTGADYGRSVAQTSDGGYIFGGSSINPYQSQDFCFIRTDQDGNIQWIKTLGGSGTDWAYSVLQTTDGGYILAGERAYLMPRGSDFWVVKLNAYPSGIEEINTTANKFKLFQNYPNPFNPMTTIEFYLPKATHVTLKIYNILGEEVSTLFSGRLFSGDHKFEWNALNYSSGIYYYQIQTGDYQETRKMILMK
jgi:hypothetical protein